MTVTLIIGSPYCEIWKKKKWYLIHLILFLNNEGKICSLFYTVIKIRAQSLRLQVAGVSLALLATPEGKWGLLVVYQCPAILSLTLGTTSSSKEIMPIKVTYSWTLTSMAKSKLTLSILDHVMESLFVKLTFKAVDQILWCYHSNETSLQECFVSTIS